MLHLRQQDTHRAVEEVATRSEKLIVEPEAKAVTDAANLLQSQGLPVLSSEAPVDASVQPETQGPSSTKVRPPTFLTPAAPRKARSSKPFSLPVLDQQEEGFTTSVQEQVHSTSDDHAVSPESLQSGKQKDPFPWKSTPDTESWSPQARRRG